MQVQIWKVALEHKQAEAFLEKLIQHAQQTGHLVNSRRAIKEWWLQYNLNWHSRDSKGAKLAHWRQPLANKMHKFFLKDPPK